MNDPTSIRDREEEIAALRKTCRRLSWRFWGALAACFVCVLTQLSGNVPLLPGSVTGSGVVSGAFARQPPSTAPPAHVLQVRELVIVDANGTPRVRIAAPLPEPIMLGKRYKRGSAVSGVLLYDAEGNERGGYVTDDEDRSAALTLDEINRAAIHIGVSDRGEMHVQLSNGQGGFASLGVLPAGPYLRLDREGRPVTVLPAPSEEEHK